MHSGRTVTVDSGDVYRKQQMPIHIHPSDPFEAKDSQVNSVEGGFLQMFMDAHVRRDRPMASESGDEARREDGPNEGRRST